MRIKKEEDEKKQEIIEIQADVRVGDFILEKGDKIIILEMDKDKDDDDDDKKDDKKKKKDDKDDDDEKDEKKKAKKEAIVKKIQDGEHLTVAEKKFIISL